MNVKWHCSITDQLEPSGYADRMVEMFARQRADRLIQFKVFHTDVTLQLGIWQHIHPVTKSPSSSTSHSTYRVVQNTNFVAPLAFKQFISERFLENCTTLWCTVAKLCCCKLCAFFWTTLYNKLCQRLVSRQTEMHKERDSLTTAKLINPANTVDRTHADVLTYKNEIFGNNCKKL